MKGWGWMFSWMNPLSQSGGRLNYKPLNDMELGSKFFQLCTFSAYFSVQEWNPETVIQSLRDLLNFFFCFSCLLFMKKYLLKSKVSSNNKGLGFSKLTSTNQNWA